MLLHISIHQRSEWTKPTGRVLWMLPQDEASEAASRLYHAANPSRPQNPSRTSSAPLAEASAHLVDVPRESSLDAELSSLDVVTQVHLIGRLDPVFRNRLRSGWICPHLIASTNSSRGAYKISANNAQALQSGPSGPYGLASADPPIALAACTNLTAHKILLSFKPCNTP